MFEKRSTEFYFGIVVWLLTLLIAYSFWVNGYEEIQTPLSPINISVAAFLFIIYLAGYFLSHGLFEPKPTRRNKILGLLISGTATTILSGHFFFFSMMGCMTMMLIIQLASLTAQRWAILVAIMVPAILITVDFWLGRDFQFTNIVVYSIVNILALTTSYRAITEQNAKLKSEQLVRELKATQILLGATTKRDERLRIARNLHDIMGHQLTALSLQLEVASHVDSRTQKEHIENAKTIGASLLANVRETVSEFREEKDLKLQEALSALVQGIPNLETHLLIDWEEQMADERQVEALFRCTQEALTNIAKHSNATRCDITVSNDEKSIILVVTDNGSGLNEIVPGNGLKGMAERINKIDGDLHFNKNLDGFELLVRLPIGEA